MKLQSFIITRFALTNIDKKQDVSSRLFNGFDLEKRFKLFEKYCYPSIMNQTNKDFRWLCLYTKDILSKDQIERIKSYKNIEHVFFEGDVNNNDKWIPELSNILSNMLEENTDYITTTRIDNDDMFSRTFVNTIRNCTKTCNEKDTIIACPTGLQLDVKTNRFYKWYKEYCNPFITLFEDVKDIKNVYYDSHGNMGKHYPVKWIVNYTGWVQVVHDNNASNKIRSSNMVDKHVIQEILGYVPN